MAFALKYQGSVSHLFQYRWKSKPPASPANLATTSLQDDPTSLQVWTHFIFSFPYFLSMEWEADSCSLLLGCQVHEQKGNPYREMLNMSLRLDQSTCVSFSRAEGEKLLDEGSLHLPKIGTAISQEPGRGTLPPGRAPHPKSLFKDSRLSKHPPSFSSSK